MKYLSITKPGIIFGNLVTVSGGYFLGSKGPIQLGLFLSTVLGVSLIIACGCVFNNYIDRDIDSLMERTKNRVLVKGLLPAKVALIYAIALGVLGSLVLGFLTNVLTLTVALIGLFFYAGVYTLWSKRHSKYGTQIGAISGAVPPVVGYCAVTNQFDIGAFSIFLILFFWQMPHFYAIAIFRLKDYAAAAIPILPLKKDIAYTRKSMLIYILLFTMASILPSLLGYAGWIYFGAALSLGLGWFYLGIKGFRTQDPHAWSRKMFLYSIINITLLCLVMAV